MSLRLLTCVRFSLALPRTFTTVPASPTCPLCSHRSWGTPRASRRLPSEEEPAVGAVSFKSLVQDQSYFRSLISSGRLPSCHSRFAFRAEVLDEVVRTNIAPFVDKGWFCTKEVHTVVVVPIFCTYSLQSLLMGSFSPQSMHVQVEKTLQALLRAHTNFRYLTEERVFREIALVQLMFGGLSAGLRQRCLREILHGALFRGQACHLG